MANKSIIEIGVESSEFEKFLGAWHDYQGALDQMPEAWQKLGASMEEAGATGGKGLTEGVSSAKDMLAATAAQTAILKQHITDVVDKQKELAEATESVWEKMKGLVESAKGFKETIGGVFEGLGKAAEVLGIGGIIGAAVGGFGLKELSEFAVQQQVGGARVGLSPGAYQAWGITMQQYLGEGALTQTWKSLLDYQKLPAFAMLGLGDKAYGMKPPELTHAEYTALAKGWTESQKSGMPFSYTQSGIAANMLGADIETIQQVANNPKEFDERYHQFQEMSKALDFGKGVAEKWASLDITFASAEGKVRDSLIKALGSGGFLPVIGKFANQLSDFISSAFTGTNFKWLIDQVTKGFTWMTERLDDPRLRSGFDQMVNFVGSSTWNAWSKNLASFGDGLKDMTASDWKTLVADIHDFGIGLHALVDKLRELGFIQGPPKPPAAGAGPNWTATDQAHWFEDPKNHDAVGEILRRTAFGEYKPSNLMALNESASSKYGIPLDILNNLTGVESTFGKNLINFKSGAKGVDQFMDKTWGQYGKGRSVWDPAANIDAAGQYLQELFTQFGSREKMLAAYNWGPGYLADDIKKYGANWLKHVPEETRNYVRDIMRTVSDPKLIKSGGWGAIDNNTDPVVHHLKRIATAVRAQPGQPRDMSITLRNETGGNVQLGTNALATV